MGMNPSTELGQTTAEYGVVLALLTVGTVAMFVALGDAIIGLFQTVLDGIG
jgi:Flp pilus assembly pilin Flp